jgi:hypothetical protein
MGQAARVINRRDRIGYAPQAVTGRDNRSAPPPARPGSAVTVPDGPARDMNRGTQPVPPADATTAAGGGPAVTATAVTTAPSGAFDPPVERFAPLRELGRGGMGVVVEAFDRSLRRPVAVKHMLSASADDLARFEREARITALLEHPGIVPIHDAGRDADGTPYYVMRRIDGEQLDTLVDGRAFPDRIARVPNVLAACDAVAFAHARAVIHRDIKPANILIGPFGETLLIDWGLACAVQADAPAASQPDDPTLTRAGAVAGTPGFMAPEQARAEPLDARADVFALGATLFYVLAGQLAYSAPGATEMIDHIGDGKPPDWSRLPGETPPALRAIVVKAMAFAPGDRYADAGELALDLRRYVTGQLVGAYRYGWLEQLRRFVNRHRAAVAVGLIALAVIAAGAVLSVRRIVLERDDANRAREIAEANQRESATKRDQLIIQHAIHLADTDPAAAITALRRLGPDSTEWRRAAAAAGAAAARGIPFGFAPVVKPSTTGRIEVSPDSRHVVIRAYRDDSLTLFDLEHRTRAQLPSLGDLRDLAWLDARWLLAGSPDAAMLVDTVSRDVVTLPVPDEIAQLVSDRRGTGYVLTRDRRVYRVDARTTAVGAPMLEAVSELHPLSGGRAIVLRDRRLELWTPAGARPIANDVESLAVAGDDLAARLAGAVCRWDVAREPVPRGCHPTKDPILTPIGISSELVFVFGSDGIAGFDRARTIAVSASAAAMNPTRNGVVFSPAPGSIEVWDRGGKFTIRTVATGYKDLAQSDDQRFVVALVATGELYVWDLDGFRPQRVQLEWSRGLLALTPDALWTSNSIGGIYRHDRRTGREVEVARDMAMTGMVDPSEHWLLTAMPVPGRSTADAVIVRNSLTNLETGVRFTGTDGEAIVFSGPSAFAIAPDGTISAIRGDASRDRVGAFPGEPTSVMLIGDYLAAITVGPQVCRMTVSRGSVACWNPPSPVDHVAVDRSGTVWTLGRNALSRWNGAGAPVDEWPSLSFSQFVWTDDHLIAAGPSSLLDLSRPGAQPVSIAPMLSFAPSNGRRILGTTSNQEIAVIDVDSGTSYVLPIPPGPEEALRTDGVSVAVMRQELKGRSALIFELRVPTDPAALRAWLATATNARPVGDTDVVAWP